MSPTEGGNVGGLLWCGKGLRLLTDKQFREVASVTKEQGELADRIGRGPYTASDSLSIEECSIWREAPVCRVPPPPRISSGIVSECVHYP